MKELILAQKTMIDVNRILKANDIGLVEAQELRDLWKNRETPDSSVESEPENSFSSMADPVLHEENMDNEEEIVQKVAVTSAPKFSNIKIK